MKPSFIPEPAHVGRVLWQTLKRFESMERRKEAAALTYTTLFALVPVITVSYSILSAIPTLQEWGQDANQQLLSYVLPQGSEVITDYLRQFSEQARQLTWIGIAALFVTCIFLLQAIEGQFNRIWNVESSRSKIQTFFRYWAVLSLGPLLFGAGVATSSVLASMPLWESSPGGPLTVLARLIPWILTTGAVTVVYLMVPNCKVPVPHALIAAVIVASAFELGKFLFSGALGLFPSYKLIYGAFAAVPLFLLWIYVSWMLLLLGAELSYGLSHYRRPGAGRHPVNERLRLAEILIKARSGDPLNRELDIRRQLGDVDAGRVTNMLNEFRKSGWVVYTEEGRWAWVRAPETIKASEFFAGQTLKELCKANAGDAKKLVKLRQWQNDFSSEFDERFDVPLSELLS
jgi:membrane protein